MGTKAHTALSTARATPGSVSAVRRVSSPQTGRPEAADIPTRFPRQVRSVIMLPVGAGDKVGTALSGYIVVSTDL